MKTTIIALIIALAAASLGGEVAQAHEIPRLRGFADVFEASDATCPADRSQDQLIRFHQHK